MIDAELRAQMIAVTASDEPSPDLLRRIHLGVRRSRSRRLAVVGGVAMAAFVAGVSLAAGGGTGASRPDVAQGTSTRPNDPTAAERGPDDDELRAAHWFSYESEPRQSGVARVAEQRWESRDGRHVARQPDGSVEVYAEDSRFPFGARGATWDELLALPADADELDRRMRQAQGGRPDTERVLDQVGQLLGRSPALLPVRRALVDAAAAHAGVTLVDGEQDSRGRPALLLEHTDRDGAVLQLWIDPGGYRLLEQRTTAGPDFPTPPTDGPAPTGGPVYAAGDLLYAEVFLRWTTEPPPGF